MTAPIYILEGAWDTPLEASQILPYFLAYAGSHREVKVHHRTIRCAEDIAYYVAKIPKGSQAFLYFACHGEPGFLDPSDGGAKIPLEAVVAGLEKAKENSVSFLHFGCCEFLKTAQRRATLARLSGATCGMWASGYTKDVDYLSSTLFDLALVSEVYVPWRAAPGKRAQSQKAMRDFYSAYSQLARNLGFSAITSISGNNELFPLKVRS